MRSKLGNSIFLTVPTEVKLSKTGKSKFILNQNQYRNKHYIVLSKAKAEFTKLISPSIPDSLAYPFKAILLTYTLYRGTRHKKDLSNVLSVVDKFVCDALVKKGVIVDDNTDYVKALIFKDGGYKKGDTYVTVEVEEIL